MLAYLCLSPPSGTWNESTLLNFLASQVNLRTIHPYGDNTITDQTLYQIARHNRRLVYLGIECRQVCFDDSAVSVLLVACVSIEELRLYGSNVKDFTLALVGMHCKLLRTIFLWYCSSATGCGLLAVAKGCPNMQYIWIDTCDEITGTGVASMGQYCTQLHQFTCNSTFLGFNVLPFFNNVQKLRKLDASFWKLAPSYTFLTHALQCLRKGYYGNHSELFTSMFVETVGCVTANGCTFTVTGCACTGFGNRPAHLLRTDHRYWRYNHVTYLSALAAARRTPCQYSFAFTDCAQVTRCGE